MSSSDKDRSAELGAEHDEGTQLMMEIANVHRGFDIDSEERYFCQRCKRQAHAISDEDAENVICPWCGRSSIYFYGDELDQYYDGNPDAVKDYGPNRDCDQPGDLGEREAREPVDLLENSQASLMAPRDTELHYRRQYLAESEHAWKKSLGYKAVLTFSPQSELWTVKLIEPHGGA